MNGDSPRFQFGSPERPHTIAGVDPAQAGILTVGLLMAVIVIRVDATAVGFGVALGLLGAAATAGFWPVAGRPAYEWVPVAARFLARRVRRENRYRSATPLLGLTGTEPAPLAPASLAGVAILGEEVAASGQQVGVVRDRRAGTYAAVLAVRGRSFELADLDEKVRRLDAWGSLLASLGRAGSPVHRLQWVERTVPDDGDQIARYLADRAEVPASHPAYASYRELVEAAGPANQPHQVFLVVAISAAKARKAIRAAGGGDRGACAVLLREVAHLQRDLQTAEVIVDGNLTPRMVAQALRTAFDPAAHVHLARRASGLPAEAGTTAGNAWPLAADAGWGCYRSDSAWHATYWVAQWPRMPVGPDFLAHLLMGTTVTRTVSLTMEPVPAGRAHREVENALVQGLADDELRARAGFLGTARRRRERDAIVRREEELAAGHADYRMSGYVTVTAPDPEALETACGEVEQAAERSRLELRRLYGEQAAAFTYTLPLARGLA